ncbi:MAG: extracellular solute-binding protein [Phycisphaerales bacterium]|nr:extracellular solute-binding protein [Phycisphaerales bacterium]
MRWIILGLIALWTALTGFAYLVVLPDQARDEDVIAAYFGVADSPPNERVRGLFEAFRAKAEAEGLSPPARWADLALKSRDERAPLVAAFRSFYNARADRPLAATPTLVWSTDDNPARAVQCQLFREWHLRTYGEPIDIVTDPTNRDITKTIVQCVAGAGPDIIESYGPIQLRQLVSAGVALDVTDAAKQKGFGPDRVFPVAVYSMSIDGRQYAFPCNIGYTVLFFHRDLFAEAGIPEPKGPWSIEQLIEVGRTLTARDTTGRRVGIMGMHPTPMAMANGARLFTDDGTACVYNDPRTVAAFRAYQDLMYRHKVMPTPAEAASMAAAGGANMNADAASASASALFAAKVSAMVTDGRWSYKGLAERNRDRVIRPAMERTIAALAGKTDESSRTERELLESALRSLVVEVLRPISDGQYAAMERALTADDRRLLLNLGVAHIPSLRTEPTYEAGARVAIANRASPRRDYAVRFLEFLASEDYNNQINFTFDSIAGDMHVTNRNGIAGPPRALPGLEGFDSPVFVEAMDFAVPTELSPFVDRARVGEIDGPIIERVTNNRLTPEEAVKQIEDGVNAQIRANLLRDSRLRAQWEKLVGRPFDPERGVREQVEAARKPAQVSSVHGGRAGEGGRGR